jgi:hypothetical protein
MYRGILMPFSSDGDTIDFIYGVINWKEVADTGTLEQLAREVDRAVASAPSAATSPVWADGPNAEPAPAPADGLPSAMAFGAQPELELDPTLLEDAGLADRLQLARDAAEAARGADTRSRAALYRALGQAYDFALAANDAPGDYAEILEDAGIGFQARAPMTPVAKLIFGVGYDKARLTEFAAALSFARRERIGSGAFTPFIERYAGGLKGLVQAERRARKPAAAPNRSASARASLRTSKPLGFVEGPGGAEEFVLLIARREVDGRLAIVAPVPEDSVLLDRAIRMAAA